jgi:hypothetical protein
MEWPTGELELHDSKDSYRLKNLKVFTERIVSMMRDYNISLKQAVIWDMEGFGNYNPTISAHIQHYLIVNGILNVNDRLFYIKVLRGFAPDIKLKELENNNDAPRDK